uniref:Uncharacterized protein n=1 Tax=Knipowitschia caucasica TaxID=637954 RepID=A0AAV2K001_KNICA
MICLFDTLHLVESVLWSKWTDLHIIWPLPLRKEPSTRARRGFAKGEGTDNTLLSFQTALTKQSAKPSRKHEINLGASKRGALSLYCIYTHFFSVQDRISG